MGNKCVCCGVDIPEGRQVCIDCATESEWVGLATRVRFFTKTDNPGFKVYESYKITKKKNILAELERIHMCRDYLDICAAGYNRSIMSEYREWKGHNVLYKLGIARDRTRSVDINQNEPMWRRVVYAILSIF